MLLEYYWKTWLDQLSDKTGEKDNAQTNMLRTRRRPVAYDKPAETHLGLPWWRTNCKETSSQGKWAPEKPALASRLSHQRAGFQWNFNDNTVTNNEQAHKPVYMQLRPGFPNKEPVRPMESPYVHGGTKEKRKQFDRMPQTHIYPGGPGLYFV